MHMLGPTAQGKARGQALSRSSRPTASRSSIRSLCSSGSSRALERMRSARPSAIALSLSWVARSLRVCVFCNNATIRNVTIVVAVLMMSCQVSTSPMTRNDGTHTSTRRTQSAKNQGREKNSAAAPAKRSKIDTVGVTSDGMCGALVADTFELVMAGRYPAGRFSKPSSAVRTMGVMGQALMVTVVVGFFVAVMVGLALLGVRVRRQGGRGSEAVLGPFEEIWHPAAHRARLQTDIVEERMVPLPS